MTTIDPNKKIQKIRTEDEIRKALLNLLERKHTLSVPPQVEDADMVLSDVIEELLEARETIEQYKAQSDASKLRTVILRWIEDGKEQAFTTDDMEALRTKAQALLVQGNVEKIMLPEPAMTTREEAEQAGNALLSQYAEPGYITNQGFIPQSCTVINGKEDAMYFIDLGGYQGTESMKELREE
jgi:hypothetical protein